MGRRDPGYPLSSLRKEIGWSCHCLRLELWELEISLNLKED